MHIFPSYTQAEATGRSLARICDRWKRKRANRIMRQFRSVPKACHAHQVVLTATRVTDSFLERRALKSVNVEPTCFWMRGRAAARALVDADRLAGGYGFTVSWEYRRCKMCGRILLGPDATAYRERMRQPQRTWQSARGPACGEECLEAAAAADSRRRHIESDSPCGA